VSSRELCTATRADGQPCRAPALPGSGYCLNHDPNRAAERQAARERGGRNRADAVRLGKLVPPRLLPIYGLLEAALREVHDGTLDPRAATAMASLGRALVAVLTAGELEGRVRDLEARASGR
jgi:hypothetical protein